MCVVDVIIEFFTYSTCQSSVECIAKIFWKVSSCRLGWLFTLLLPLLARSFVFSHSPICLVFALFPDLPGCFSEILCSYLYLKVFSSNNFRVSYLTLRPLIHSELIFCAGWKIQTKFHFFLMRISRFPSTISWRDWLFSNIYFWCLHQQSGGSRQHDIFCVFLFYSILFHWFPYFWQ